jgi:two-component system, NtrC family, nitrogen regulation sensor histidine kinase NtrY
MGEGGETFQRLTSTIVRQVGDLRRMVDEFSSFARMPKPNFREENLTDIVRQAVFLHDVANPDIRFVTEVPETAVHMTCDRRLLDQALINVVKNAVEAIGQKAGVRGEIDVRLNATESAVTIAISDNGIGLPANRESIIEPYVTMREGGTGLGLAIVQKIVEEHGGTLSFADNEGGGTMVTIVLPIHAPIDEGEAMLPKPAGVI